MLLGNCRERCGVFAPLLRRVHLALASEPDGLWWGTTALASKSDELGWGPDPHQKTHMCPHSTDKL
eukprot:364282-Chlamydomonas_euryale.AAC.32